MKGCRRLMTGCPGEYQGNFFMDQTIKDPVTIEHFPGFILNFGFTIVLVVGEENLLPKFRGSMQAPTTAEIKTYILYSISN